MALKNKKIVFVALAQLMMGSQALARESEPILLFSGKKAGKTTYQQVTTDQYVQNFRKIFEATEKATLSTVKEQEAHTAWALRDVIVGLGLKFTAGLGSACEISVNPKVRLGFSNSTHPKFPSF